MLFTCDCQEAFGLHQLDKTYWILIFHPVIGLFLLLFLEQWFVFHPQSADCPSLRIVDIQPRQICRWSSFLPLQLPALHDFPELPFHNSDLFLCNSHSQKICKHVSSTGHKSWKVVHMTCRLFICAARSHAQKIINLEWSHLWKVTVLQVYTKIKT